jgi:hypothetical protein
MGYDKKPPKILICFPCPFVAQPYLFDLVTIELMVKFFFGYPY